MKILNAIICIVAISACTLVGTKAFAEPQHKVSKLSIEKLIDVQGGMVSTDSLNDVFPTINVKNLPEGRLPSCLVDGKFLPGNVTGNSLVLPHTQGPINITFDIAPDGHTQDTQLNELKIWIQGLNDNWQGHLPNFVGHLGTSLDGKSFTKIPESDVELIAPKVRNYNCITWRFPQGMVKGFRYLRVVSLGHQNKTVRLAEIDGDISGVVIPKSTRIMTRIQPIEASAIKQQPPKESQTIPSPMKVHFVKFVGPKLALAHNNKTILDLTSLIYPDDPQWKQTQQSLSQDKLSSLLTRQDGLTKQVTVTIDGESRVTVECEIKAPDHPVEYEQTSLNFNYAAVKYDGVVDGSSAVYYDGNASHVLEIGDYSPYVIFKSKTDDVELQFYMPAWYNVMGRISVMGKDALSSWQFFVKTRNTWDELEDKKLGFSSRVWNPVNEQLQAGQAFKYKINIAAFAINPKRTLGQIDIEDYPHLPPLKHVDTGEEGQRLSGQSTVLHRDKMLFMGYDLPEPAKEKLGHSVLTHVVVGSQPGMIDRYKRGGVGVVVITGSDYDDVSHGISWRGDYDQSPPNTKAFVDELHQNGMKVVHWVSPRGFLNKKWNGRPKDPMIDLHPDWFLPHAHWGGNYQTVDSYKTEPNEWVINKITGDMKQYGLNGVAYDSFPQSGTIVGPNGQTLVSRELSWGKYFYQKIHQTSDGALVIGNRAIPRYDEYHDIDSAVVENSLWMFLNEVTKGHAAYGRAYTAYLQWGQLYNWWLPLSFMHHNFCDYDMALGWTPDIWLHWRNSQIAGERKYKDMDKYVVPLWHLMGKGTRIYAASIGHRVRQIEARMPDGSVVILVTSVNPLPMNVQVVPQNIEPGEYDMKVTVDTCKSHKNYGLIRTDTRKTPGIEMDMLPPYSITVLRFNKLSN